MGISDNFTRSVGNFKAKHEAIYELQQIKNADYLSLEELQEASGRIIVGLRKTRIILMLVSKRKNQLRNRKSYWQSMRR